MVSASPFINTFSMKQSDLYYFETIKMTSQAGTGVTIAGTGDILSKHAPGIF